MKQAAEEFFTIIFTSLLTALMVLFLFEIRDLKPAAHSKEQPIKIEPLLDQEFYSPFEDIIYVKSTDKGWEVGTEEYGILFVEMSYNQAISMASVLTWVGYQCDYSCKDEMLDKALSEHYQLMYHE